MNRLGWQAWVAALALIALGAVGGIAFDRFHVRGGGGHGLHEQVRRDPVAYMERELTLTPEQRTRIAEIFERRQGEIDTVWQDTHNRLIAAIDRLVAEISGELDSAQIPRFNALVKKLHSSPDFPYRPH
jgi:Spy/CpxP family protein refolding chaperone